MSQTKLESLLLAGAIALAGCTDDIAAGEPAAPAASGSCYPLEMRNDFPWYGTNSDKVTGWLDAKGCKSAAYDPAQRPVALFDWDNTILKGDIGDAITFHVIAH